MPNTEKKRELTRQIIIRVKEVIADLTDTEVIQRMEEAGEQTSLSTVRRIRAEGSEDSGFNYNLTVRPFAKVFLELSSKPVDVEALDSEEDKDRAALDNMIQLKNYQIDSLELQVEALQKQLAEAESSRQRQVQHLKEQLISKDAVLEDRKEVMKERRDFILRLESEKASLRKESSLKSLIIGILVVVLLVALVAAPF